MEKEQNSYEVLNNFNESHLPKLLIDYEERVQSNEIITITSEDKIAIKEWFDKFFNTEKFYEEGSELYIHSKRINALLNYMKINQHGHNHNVSFFTNSILIYLATKGVNEYIKNNDPHKLITKLIQIGTMGILHDIGYLEKYKEFTREKKERIQKNGDKDVFSYHAEDGAKIARDRMEKLFEKDGHKKLLKEEYKNIKIDEEKFINGIEKGIATHSSPLSNNPNEVSEIEKETETIDTQRIIYIADKADYFNEDRTPLRFIWKDIHQGGTMAFKRIAFATEDTNIKINNREKEIIMVLNIDPEKINNKIKENNIENNYHYENYKFIEDYLKYFGKKTQPIIDEMSKSLFPENDKPTFYTEINFKNGEKVIINNETLSV